MTSPRERRAAALEAIAQALLELAAVERDSEDRAPREILVDRRNCEREVGLSPRAFADAAARDFPAFRVSRRLTATKADVLAWMKSRRVPSKPARPVTAAAKSAEDPDAFLQKVNARFVIRVGRPMTDMELHQADLQVDVARAYDKLTGTEHKLTVDEVAASVQEKIGTEPVFYTSWRSLGLDPAVLERDAEKLRQQVYETHPEMTWRQRIDAVYKMWGTITEPLDEARRAERAAARAAKKAERAKSGRLGLKS